MSDIEVTLGLNDRDYAQGLTKAEARTKRTAVAMDRDLARVERRVESMGRAYRRVADEFGPEVAKNWIRMQAAQSRAVSAMERSGGRLGRVQARLASGARTLNREWSSVAAVSAGVAGGIAFVTRQIDAYGQKFAFARGETAALRGEWAKLQTDYQRAVSGLAGGSDAGVSAVRRLYDATTTGVAGILRRPLNGFEGVREVQESQAILRGNERRDRSRARDEAGREALVRSSGDDVAVRRFETERRIRELGQRTDIANDVKGEVRARLLREQADYERQARVRQRYGERAGSLRDLLARQQAAGAEGAAETQAKLAREGALRDAALLGDPQSQRYAAEQAERVYRLTIQRIQAERAERDRARADQERAAMIARAERAAAARSGVERDLLSARRRAAEGIADASERAAALDAIERERIRLEFAEKRKKIEQEIEGAERRRLLDQLRRAETLELEATRRAREAGLDPDGGRRGAVGVRGGLSIGLRTQVLGAGADNASGPEQEQKKQTGLLREIRDDVRRGRLGPTRLA